MRDIDRLLLTWMDQLWPNLLGVVQVVKPETVLRWHRAGFRAFWRWKSRSRAGRPKIDRDLRDLIERMNQENPLWGAPRIHGEHGDNWLARVNESSTCAMHTLQRDDDID